MKYLSFVFILFSVGCGLYGQNDRSEMNFLERLIRQAQPDGQIVYTDKISKSDLDKIKLRLKNNTIYDCSSQNQNSIILTRLEKKSLLDQFEFPNDPYWQENLFPGSKLIKEEEVMSYIKKTTQDYLENYNNPNNTEVDKMALVKTYQRPNVFKFSRPVYLRNRTLCLLFFSSVCGNPCGFDELCFYKIDNNIWTKWVVVNSNQY